MPSYEVIILGVSVIAMAALAWRLVTALLTSAQYSSRATERANEQRDRFVMQLIERRDAADANQGVQMANIHSSEHLRQHAMDLQRDDEEADKRRAAIMAKRQLKRHMEKQNAQADSSGKDAFE